MSLPITKNVNTLPPSLRRPNQGVTRWGNLVFGLAVDGAIKRGAQPIEIVTAFRAGRLAAEASMLFTKSAASLKGEPPLGYMGSVVIRGDELEVTVGRASGEPPSSISFEIRDGLCVPLRSRAEYEEGVIEVLFPPSFDYGLVADKTRDVPPEFAVAVEMDDAESVVTADPAAFVFMGDISEPQP